MKAIYAGSFDPFTNGHLDIVKQAAEIFDVVYIVIACNSEKNRHYASDKMKSAIKDILAENKIDNVACIMSNELIADKAKELDCTYLIRGLRNPNDYNYEENIAKVNHEINSNLKTIYFRADNEVISSSFIREMFKYHKDISKYVDNNILKIMEDSKNG